MWKCSLGVFKLSLYKSTRRPCRSCASHAEVVGCMSLGLGLGHVHLDVIASASPLSQLVTRSAAFTSRWSSTSRSSAIPSRHVLYRCIPFRGPACFGVRLTGLGPRGPQLSRVYAHSGIEVQNFLQLFSPVFTGVFSDMGMPGRAQGAGWW